MKILILTQYFPPETGAPQNRLYQLAVRLKAAGDEVSVLTAMPNYPQMKIYPGYKGKIFIREEMNGIMIHRSWIYAGKSRSILPRLLNYFSFVFTSFFAGWFKTGRMDFLLCESPPLFLGITAYLLSRLKRAKLIFNVSDLWPESAEKLGLISNKTLLGLSTKLEEFLYRKSFVVSGQTQGILKNISSRFPAKPTFWLRNGNDMRSLQDLPSNAEEWRKKEGFAPGDFLLIYAGILGHAQGLEVILHAAGILRDQKEVKFLLVGSGPVKEQLTDLKNRYLLKNVFFYPAMPRKELLGMIPATDAAIIPLRKLELFKGAIPSKIFENLALRKPLLLGVEGEAKDLFIDEAKAGLAFVPEDAPDLAEKIIWMMDHPEMMREFGRNGYHYVLEKFNWDIIARDFREFILTR
jgi:glycosyltransferase involved in cell wall biosynthesis